MLRIEVLITLIVSKEKVNYCKNIESNIYKIYKVAFKTFHVLVVPRLFLFCF